MTKTMNEIKSILATDCGSTTTKAILIEKTEGEYRLKVRGEAPTTVEAPFDDVTIGARNAITEVEELAGRTLLRGDKVITPDDGAGTGVDLYLSTSSAGGGLQMAVAGVVRKMTAESAERAALGAGAIVMDVLSVDDGYKPHEKIQRIRHLRPDIILMSGGIDGGTKTHVIEIAETIIAADPKPRFGSDFQLPLIYAGNIDVHDEITRLMAGHADLEIVDNIRPVLERENLGPAREAIHELFLKHVMAHAPGYDRLMTWTDVDIMSTPAAVGRIIQTIAKQHGINVLAVDIGGATTDVFSVFGETFNRTVSANLGMSYSMCNVLLEAGLENIKRWLPVQIDDHDIVNRLRNKMIRPTTIPHTLEDLLVEHGVCREALRLAFAHHKELAVSLRGVQQQRSISEAFAQSATGETLVDMFKLDMIVGSGGVLSHSPSRHQSALMMIDAFQPLGFTTLTVDSIFMMPQLGVFSSVHPEGASQVFERDCLIYLGTCIAPQGRIKKPGTKIADFSIQTLDGSPQSGELLGGDLLRYELPIGAEATVTVSPLRAFDFGAGKGRSVTAKALGGTTGLILDGRGRPLEQATDEAQRIENNRSWLQAMGLRYE